MACSISIRVSGRSVLALTLARMEVCRVKLRVERRLRVSQGLRVTARQRAGLMQTSLDGWMLGGCFSFSPAPDVPCLLLSVL